MVVVEQRCAADRLNTQASVCVQVQVRFEDRDHLRKKAIENHQEDAQAVLKYRKVIDRASDDQMHQVPKK